MPENFGWNLIKEKSKLQRFEGDVSPTSIESVSINNEEEENSNAEYESDSDIYSHSDEEQYFSLVQKDKRLLTLILGGLFRGLFCFEVG